jgi:hypothetical protein
VRRPMDGTSSEHDLWMAKITNALRSFRMATQRKAEQTQARPPEDGRAHDDSREHDRT